MRTARRRAAADPGHAGTNGGTAPRSWSRRSARSGCRGSSPTPPRRCAGSRAWSSPSSPTRRPRPLPSTRADRGEPSASTAPRRGRCRSGRRRPRADRPDRPRPGRRGPGPGLQVGRQGRGRRRDAREAGKLQLQLYMLAARELWDTSSPAGYTGRSAAPATAQPKGLLRRSSPTSWRASTRARGTTRRRGVRGGLDDAAGEAEEIIAAIQAGEVIRDPLGGSCPDYCDFQPICRRERGLPEEEPWSDEGEEE